MNIEEFDRMVELERALGAAIRHIEHMARWIGDQNAGYSFEALGEDRSEIYVLGRPEQDPERVVWEIKYEDRPTEYLDENPGISARGGGGILSVRSILASEVPTTRNASSFMGEVQKALDALDAIIAATGAYLPPDGISKDECISRILEATDNPRINAALKFFKEKNDVPAH